MKLIKPSFEILEQLPGLEGMYKQIELAGRTCYKSEDKITEDSAKEFVDRMIKSGHGAMLEHGTVYLSLDMTSREQYFKYCYNKFSKANSTGSAEYSTWRGFVTTNLRVLVENDWLEDLQYICEPTEYHEKRHTVKFTCDRGVSHEFVRHRVFSFAQESTRYCNYSKDKFGNEITCILPPWLSENDLPKGFGYTSDDWGSLICEFYYEATEKGKSEGFTIEPVRNFVFALQTSEQLYFSLLKEGWKAQEARSVLPNALKTELVMTGFESDWKHFFELRCPGSAHPQARELAIPLQEKFKELKWVD
jgi:thymidylate synthase (FAD)